MSPQLCCATGVCRSPATKMASTKKELNQSLPYYHTTTQRGEGTVTLSMRNSRGGRPSLPEAGQLSLRQVYWRDEKPSKNYNRRNLIRWGPVRGLRRKATLVHTRGERLEWASFSLLSSLVTSCAVQALCQVLRRSCVHTPGPLSLGPPET